jgi:segregation and condensation protein B
MAAEEAKAIEAVLMVATEPVDSHLLAQLLEITPGRVEDICAGLAQSYDDEDRGFVLVKVAGGYRFQSRPDLAPYVERFVLEGQSARLSAAALETLAIVAYKQPVSRAQIAAIRGVSADGVIRTLLQRGFIEETGRDPGPGQAVLYATTSLFLERLGLDTVDQLPLLGDFVPGPEVMDALEQGLRQRPRLVGIDDPDDPADPGGARGDGGDGGAAGAGDDPDAAGGGDGNGGAGGTNGGDGNGGAGGAGESAAAPPDDGEE